MKDEDFQKIYDQIDEIPSVPGVYKFLNSKRKILYVGKALNIRSRVSSYFNSTHTDRPHIIPMIDQIDRIEYIETDNEVEALVLESALIKENRPKYNIDQKDDKSYAWIYVNTQDEIPTVKIVRTINRSEFRKGRLFGPYPNSRATRQIFKYIRRVHPFCTCRDPKEPCLYYHLDLCRNPKFGAFSKEEYLNEINGLMKFLSGNKKREISSLRKKMDQYSKLQDYEKAAEIRDKIEDLQHLGERKKMYEDEYDFKEKQRKAVLIDMKSLQSDLNLDIDIKRIECYDISNIQGKYAYGSMTVLDNGEINSSLYRIFKIKGEDSPDDYRMLAEVISRRVKHINKTGDPSLSKNPDIILIDGGKGQLSSVQPHIPEGIVLMGISKGRSKKKKGARIKDEFWIYRGKKIVKVRVSKPKNLIKLRDEAHRFSLSHHRKARMKNKYESVFEKVEGIGPKRKKELLKEFGSVKNMKKASTDDLDKIIKNKTVSNRLYKTLQE